MTVTIAPLAPAAGGSGDLMMNRRVFMGGVAAATVLAPRAASAQTPPTARRIGLLMATTPTAAAHIVVAFADGLRELGHVEGKNVRFEYRWAEGHRERFAEMAADLVRQPVDVLVASSQAAALAAQRATRTIPIVMVNASDPVEAGLVASLARPGGNVTGLSEYLTREIRAKQLQLLREALPKMSWVAVLHSAATTVGLREYEAAGQTVAVRFRISTIWTRTATTLSLPSRRWPERGSTPCWCRPTRSCSRSGSASQRWPASTGCRACTRPGSMPRREG